MATTPAQQMRARRARRRRHDVQLAIVSETDLRELALRGYARRGSSLLR
jgi:hypothetical protein